MPHDKQSEEYGIVPATGASFDMKKDVAIPTSYSAGGWTYGNEGFVQQTFLGASIRDFTLNAGFNNTSSTLSVNLVSDEYNASDKTSLGYGDDVYHSGITGDNFIPPAVGAPVFFKFGKHHATVEEAFRVVYDSTYINPTTGKNYNTIPITPARVKDALREIPKGQGGVAGVAKVANPEVFFSGVPSQKGKYYPDDPILSTTDAADQNMWVDESVLHNTNIRGSGHLSFGGILQAYTQNRGGEGNPTYSVSITDPRELLGNVELILANYAGTTFNNPNMLNIFGFLEHNPSTALRAALEGYYDNPIGAGMGGQIQIIGIPPERIQPVFFTDPRPLVGGYPKGGEVDKVVNYNTGEISFVGDDLWCKSSVQISQYVHNPGIIDGLPKTEFPITGTGFSRRNDEGMPVYRIVQAMKALMNYDGKTPEEYVTAGYGGPINFRGYNYVVDLTGLPIHLVSSFYRMNYEKMTLLDFCQEICEITSHEMFVSLLPVIDHPAVGFISDYNKHLTETKPANWKTKMVEGVIRVEGISKTQKPKYGTVKAFIDKLTLGDNNVKNSDVGFELSNVVTDKFVVGAQEVKMYYFSDNRDRDHLQVRKQSIGRRNNANGLLGDQWYHWKSLQQQILPFYGFLGKEAVTIPRGWGSFQQILLDASSCDAIGVGNYYIATELELRAATVSYERWAQLLIRYNSEYMASMELNDALEEALLSKTVAPAPSVANAPPGTVELDPRISQNFGVSVPRCVFMSDKNFVGSDNLPASPCSPPFGYPLYYKRAEKIGIPEVGIVKVINSVNSIITNLGTLKGKFKDGQQAEQISMAEFTAMKSEIKRELKSWKSARGITQQPDLEDMFINVYTDANGVLKPSNIEEAMKETEIFVNFLTDAVNKTSVQRWNEATQAMEITADANSAIADQIALLKDKISSNLGLIRNKNKLAKLSLANARKVYNFVKSVADKHLGKTFLVKIPSDANLKFADAITFKDPVSSKQSFVAEIDRGPFGFRPEPVNFEFGHYYNKIFQSMMINLASTHKQPFNFLEAGTRPDSTTGPRHKPQFGDGALKSNYNAIDNQWLFNYAPATDGGYLDYTQMPQTYNYADLQKSVDTMGLDVLPPSVRQNLFPMDSTNFIDEVGKMKAYVRYDNSQYLNFQGVSAQSMSQQVLSFGGKFIPDILEQLENTKPDKFTSFGSKSRLQGHRQRRSAAFVQVNMDSKLYMPPRSDVHNTKTFGMNVKDIGAMVKPKLIFDEETCEFKPSYGFYRSHWVPADGGGAGASTKIVDFLRIPTTMGSMIVTDPVNLDGENVYALITVPGTVKSTIDSRYADGPMQSFNAADIKNLLTMDTVKIPEFRKPSIKGTPTAISEELCAAGQINIGQTAQAIKAVRDGFKHVSMASPERSIQYTTSSPIYPNLVVLPLMSKERCYGPWISSAHDDGNAASIRHIGIGGKLEFIKDEELAPWNYGGFDVLNAAGSVKANFSNSELLFSERGGIVFAGLPENDLGKSLDSVGPLVTSISVNIGPAGISTTYKMDLYTPRFGKLQAQKESALQKFGRSRQQQVDERNKSMRGSLKKGMTGSVSISNEISKYGDLIEASKSSSQFLSDFEQSKTSSDMVLGSVNVSETIRHDGAGNALPQKAIGYDVSMQPTKIHQEALSALPQESRDGAVRNTGGGDMSSWVVPASMDVSHEGGMASRGYFAESNRQELYYATGNPGEVKTPQEGLPTANDFRNSSSSSMTSRGGGASTGGTGGAGGTTGGTGGTTGGTGGTGGTTGGTGGTTGGSTGV